MTITRARLTKLSANVNFSTDDCTAFISSDFTAVNPIWCQWWPR